MKNLKILIFLCCLSQIALAQKHFKAGYIILSNGDTLHGEIRQTAPETLSEQVVYRKSYNSSTQSYSPSEVRQFFFEGENYYISDSIALRGLGNEIYFKQLFLKKLLDGPIELYRLNYQVSEDQSPFYSYQNRFYFFKEKGNNPMIDLLDNNYKNKLRNAFKSRNCNIAKDTNYNYTDEGMSNLIAAYNTCLGGNSYRVFIPKSSKGKVQIGFSFGIADQRVRSDFEPYAEFQELEKLGYQANLFVEIPVSKVVEVRGGLQYKHRSFDGVREVVAGEEYENSGAIVPLNARLEIKQLNIPLQLKADLLQSKFRPYILVGVFFGFGLNNSGYYDLAQNEPVDGKPFLNAVQIDPFPVKINAIEVGWNAGLGLSWEIRDKKEIFFELTHNRARSDGAPGSDLFISQNDFSLQAGFKF
jgi:hypothetical protein